MHLKNAYTVMNKAYTSFSAPTIPILDRLLVTCLYGVLYLAVTIAQSIGTHSRESIDASRIGNFGLAVALVAPYWLPLRFRRTFKARLGVGFATLSATWAIDRKSVV